MRILRLTTQELQFTVFFAVIVLIELVSGSTNALLTVHFIAKPAIVSSLIIAFYRFSKSIDKTVKKLVLIGLIFSVIGDIILMLVDAWQHAFTMGLVSFLLAHVFYSSAFWKQRSPKKSPWPIIIVLLAYAVFLFSMLKDNLGAMMVPVVLYMLIILTMATLAFLRKKSEHPLGYWLVFAGAILFLISDSLLAINKFLQPLPMAHIGIMATYALAQYGIVFGILKSKL
jgi:uncharacterized membrane protein YhhN